MTDTQGVAGVGGGGGVRPRILEGEDLRVSLPSPVFSGPGCADVRLCLRQGTGDLSTGGGGCGESVGGHYTTMCTI